MWQCYLMLLFPLCLQNPRFLEGSSPDGFPSLREIRWNKLLSICVCKCSCSQACLFWCFLSQDNNRRQVDVFSIPKLMLICSPIFCWVLWARITRLQGSERAYRMMTFTGVPKNLFGSFFNGVTGIKSGESTLTPDKDLHFECITPLNTNISSGFLFWQAKC